MRLRWPDLPSRNKTIPGCLLGHHAALGANFEVWWSSVSDMTDARCVQLENQGGMQAFASSRGRASLPTPII